MGARQWQRTLFDAGWLLPGNPPEYGGRNATLPQLLAHQEELARRGIYHSFNPQGVGIIAASILTFGTEEQKKRWAVPILRAEMTASLGMSEPGAGSDLAGLLTRAVRDGDHFVVNGQKVWTSGAHDADVLLTFVRTDPDAPKHKGISVLLIPTNLEGVVRRPFASMTGLDDVDLNEVFFTDVRVPGENLIGELNKGWTVANGSLGHERTMLWIGYADQLQNLISDAPSGNEWYATLQMDLQALRLLGYEQLSGVKNPATISMLKLFGSEAAQRAAWHALEECGSRPSSTPRGPLRTTTWTTTRSARAGSSGTRGPSPGRSPAARPRSTATSSPSAFSASRGEDHGRPHPLRGDRQSSGHHAEPPAEGQRTDELA